MKKIGYSRVSAAGVELEKFGDTKGQEYPMPSVLVLTNGDQVMGFSLGEVLADGSRIVERWLDDDPAEPYYTPADRTVAFDGEKVVVTQHYDVVPPPAVDLAAYAADARYRREVGGVAWNGDGAEHVISTDRDSQTKLIAEFIAINASLREDGKPWKFAGGEFASLTNAQMSDVVLTARSHIEDAFGREAAALAQIESGAFTTTAQIDTLF